MTDWLWSDPWTLVGVAGSGVGIYLAVVLATRISGLRSFSKMSSFDFAMTVAVGSLMASTLLSDRPSLADGIVGLAALYGVQYVVARLRVSTSFIHPVVDNEPILLMHGATMLEENMDRARITRDDVLAKLREANVLEFAQVRAVILETTGDISVLHTDDPEMEVEEELLSPVRRP